MPKLGTVLAPQAQSSPSVLSGVQQLRQIKPNENDDDINDTFKISFENTSKRKMVESYHCSGFKKLCIVQYVHLPELTLPTHAPTDVSMTSLVGSRSSLDRSQQNLVQQMTPASSQQSLGSAASLTSLGSPPQKFTATFGTPKQIAKTIPMPKEGCFSTEQQLARANLPPPETPETRLLTPNDPPPIFQHIPLAVGSQRKITKTSHLSKTETEQLKVVADTEQKLTFGQAILKGAEVVATEAAAATAEAKQMTALQQNLPR